MHYHIRRYKTEYELEEDAWARRQRKHLFIGLVCVSIAAVGAVLAAYGII